MPYDPATGMQFDDPNNSPQITQERGTIVTFELHPVHMKAQSEKEGRPIYEDRLYIKIVQPMNRNSEVHRPAKDEDKLKYPVSWRQFEQGQEQIGSGTPLEAWAQIGPAELRMLKALGVHTVDALAEVSDTNLKNYGMGALALRTKAKTWLEQAETGAPLTRALAENADLRAQQDVDRAALKALQDQVAKLMEKSDGA